MAAVDHTRTPVTDLIWPDKCVAWYVLVRPFSVLSRPLHKRHGNGDDGFSRADCVLLSYSNMQDRYTRFFRSGECNKFTLCIGQRSTAFFDFQLYLYSICDYSPVPVAGNASKISRSIHFNKT